MRHITKHFQLLKGANVLCSRMSMDSLAMTLRYDKPIGRDGHLPGCREKDQARVAVGVHMAPLVKVTNITIMITAGVDPAVHSDVASVFLASDQAWAGVSLMNYSPCALRLR